MSEMYIDVDTAITVPVNVFPLTDDTDFKTRETGIVYNQAGMDLVWNFQTTAGVTTQTAVTPTTAGVYDWTHSGDGMYKIEIPASAGGSINNDAEGTGWFTGFATGVLPWRGPMILFRAAGINNVLIDSAYSATRGLSGTALPDAVADAAGGVVISDAGGLDIDALDTSVTAIEVDTNSLNDTKIPNTLNTTASGNIGIDWANVENPTTALDLSATDIQLVDTTTTNTDMVGTDNALLAASINLTAGAVDNVTLVATTTTNTDMVGTNSAATSAKQDTMETTLNTVNTNVGTAGAGLTNINLPNQTMDIVGSITGSLSGTVGSVTGAVGSVTAQVSADLTAINGATIPVDNLELQYDTTGLTGDNFPATQSQIGSLSTGAGGLSTTADSDTLTTGSETGTFASTSALDAAYHQITQSGGNTEIYYEFNVGTTGKATEVIWDGRVNSNGDSMAVYGYDWIAVGWSQVGTIIGSNSSSDIEATFIFTNSMTGTGVNVGLVRCRFLSTDATQLYTDRILCEFTSIAAESQIFNSGVAQSGGNNSIQLASGAVSTNLQYTRAKVVLTGGTGAGQEAVITNSVASTDTLTTTPAWITNPDSTTSYEVVPAQVHTSVINGGYENGNVYIDSVNGTSGTEIGVNGTTTVKVDNITDANTIASAKGLSSFSITNSSTVTLVATQNYDMFIGVAWILNLGGQDISNCNFRGAQVNGVGTGSGFAPLIFDKCAFSTCTLPTIVATESTLTGTFTSVSGKAYTFLDSYSGNASAAAPVFIFTTTAVLNLRRHSGEITIESMVAGNTLLFEGNGKVTLSDASNTGGTVYIRGNVEIDKGSFSGTITELANITITSTAANLSTVDTVVDTINTNVGTAGAGLTDVGGMSTAMKAEVNAEMVDTLVTDTYAEPSGVHSSTASLKDKIGLLAAKGRNKITQTATTQLVRNDGDSGTIATSTVSDDTTTAIRGKLS